MATQTSASLPHAASIPHPPSRRLRGYAFDPSLSVQLETMGVNEVVFAVPWEEDLQTGPVGEYLEVVDFDPASNCFYEPVDLNNPHLIAQDGLAPSEGNPQFHQQMAYAVAMTTIRNFEQALGRKALWRSHTLNTSDKAGTTDGKKTRANLKEVFVQRLRIYPHALREANAFYSPQKKALLFGYFPATTAQPGTHMAGGMVFTCLSHDIIAHETTHALLDGMHRRFIEPTHPDSLAFHEAFSDIVALLQHFSFPEVLRHQIAKTRGDLASENLLGQLAQQFGVAIGNYGALRDALGEINPATGRWEPQAPDPQAYLTIMEPHARGSILVAAVFDAFTAIYKDRVSDLLRIASGGRGVLPEGALHPDLVNRLADEAAKAAKHVLLMCIRALDYCPPVDLTFGDYLRSVITADADIVPDDDRGYRVAFIEAFRRRGIYPNDVRNLSVESLRWPGARDDEDQDFDMLASKLRGFPDRARYFATREESYNKIEEMRGYIHKIISDQIKDFSNFERLTGLAFSNGNLLPGLALGAKQMPVFEIHSLRPAQRVGPDGDLLSQLVVVITQRRTIPIDPANPHGPTFQFRGGCTLLLDLDSLNLRYRIVKPIDDNNRLERQRQYMQGNLSGSLRATYFAPFTPSAMYEPFALLHREY
jgi:hypothetical protein